MFHLHMHNNFFEFDQNTILTEHNFQLNLSFIKGAITFKFGFTFENKYFQTLFFSQLISVLKPSLELLD